MQLTLCESVKFYFILCLFVRNLNFPRGRRLYSIVQSYPNTSGKPSILSEKTRKSKNQFMNESRAVLYCTVLYSSVVELRIKSSSDL